MLKSIIMLPLLPLRLTMNVTRNMTKNVRKNLMLIALMEHHKSFLMKGLYK